MANLLSGTLPFLDDLLRYALISGQYCEEVGRMRGGWVEWEVPKNHEDTLFKVVVISPRSINHRQTQQVPDQNFKTTNHNHYVYA